MAASLRQYCFCEQIIKKGTEPCTLYRRKAKWRTVHTVVDNLIKLRKKGNWQKIHKAVLKQTLVYCVELPVLGYFETVIFAPGGKIGQGF